MITFKDMWGRMVPCGRLAIGLAGFVPSPKPITNRRQVANLPHGAPVCTNHFLESRAGLYTDDDVSGETDVRRSDVGARPDQRFGECVAFRRQWWLEDHRRLCFSSP
jgi:hypothetical protein